MKKHLLSLAVALALGATAYAQGPTMRYSLQFLPGPTTFDWLEGVTPMPTGGFAYTGSSLRNQLAINLIQIADDGTLVLQAEIAGPGAISGHAIESVAGGGFVVAGMFRRSGTTLPIPLMTRLDAAGTPLWSRIYGTMSDYRVRAVRARRGDFATIAPFYPSFTGNQVFSSLIVADSSTGNPVFHRIYDLRVAIQGQSVETQLHFNDMRVMRDGGFLLAGEVISLSGGIFDFAMRTDPNGNILWSRVFDGTSFGARSIDVDGNSIFYTGYDGSRSFVTQLDLAGNQLGTIAIADFFASQIEIDDQDPTRILIAGGNTQTTPMTHTIIDLDPSLAPRYAATHPLSSVSADFPGDLAISAICRNGWATATFNETPLSGTARRGLHHTGIIGDPPQPCAAIPFVPQIQRIDRYPLVRHDVRTTDERNFRPIDLSARRWTPNIAACLNPVCVADVAGTGGPGPDGGVGMEDLFAYIALFESEDLCADVDDGSGTGIRDGALGIEDLVFFLFRFGIGC
jgi:hypothetical protein